LYGDPTKFAYKFPQTFFGKAKNNQTGYVGPQPTRALPLSVSARPFKFKRRSEQLKVGF
jgi:hypothetical protein